MTAPPPSSSDLDRFSAELQVTRDDSRRLSHTAPGITPRENHAELIAALEELSIAEGDLRSRYEALVDAQHHLEVESDRYHTLFQLAPDPYLVTDQKGTIEEANDAAGDLLGVPSALLAKKPLLAYLDGEARGEFESRVDRLTTAGRLDKWALAIEARNGSIVPMEATASRLGNGSIGWLFRDTSVRRASEDSMHALNRSLNARVAQRTRELEGALEGEQSARKEAEAANRIKTELFARLSHEFRTPLHAVSGYLEILEQNIHGVLTADQRRDVERIHQAQEHLMTLVNMILDFAKLEGGPIELSMAEIPIEETLRGAEALVAPQFAKKSIAYTHHPGKPSVTVFADRERVQQILLNLLANAMRFTPSGGAVDLDWRIENDALLVHVRDTGPGIPEEKAEQIFEPFVQLRAPGSVPSGGTGLGLAISRDLARAMGGDVRVTSTVGVGSVFTLLLPLRKHSTASKLSASKTAS
ncbi:MAG TPA: ATP-binding protein [Gemmatimonadaceae bacterium]|nr:ATP-binding protein [Gemmatimonadaceae bacterium]